MYQIIASVPRYGNRDEYIGETKYIHQEYRYQTLALAERMVSRCYQYDDEGCPLYDDVHYYVSDCADIYRRPVQKPVVHTAANWDEDIPF